MFKKLGLHPKEDISARLMLTSRELYKNEDIVKTASTEALLGYLSLGGFEIRYKDKDYGFSVYPKGVMLKFDWETNISNVSINTKGYLQIEVELTLFDVDFFNTSNNGYSLDDFNLERVIRSTITEFYYECKGKVNNYTLDMEKFILEFEGKTYEFDKDALKSINCTF
ncbi:hypothetical protein D3C81_09170 [compost metagenome]